MESTLNPIGELRYKKKKDWCFLFFLGERPGEWNHSCFMGEKFFAPSPVHAAGRHGGLHPLCNFIYYRPFLPLRLSFSSTSFTSYLFNSSTLQLINFSTLQLFNFY